MESAIPQHLRRQSTLQRWHPGAHQAWRMATGRFRRTSEARSRRPGLHSQSTTKTEASPATTGYRAPDVLVSREIACQVLDSIIGVIPSCQGSLRLKHVPGFLLSLEVDPIVWTKIRQSLDGA